MYDYARLMEETRKLAVHYRETTGQTLPIAAELARFDCIKLLEATKPTEPLSAVDCIFSTNGVAQRCQIKGRVIFNPEKTGHRVGPFHLEGDWDTMLVVLYDHQYHPTEIIALARDVLTNVLSQPEQMQSAHPLEITVAKCKALGREIWVA